jgi:hypothetical protein
MSHFYDIQNGTGVLSESSTAPQARKAGHLPSVTTVLGIIKDPFIDYIWKPRKLIELAREHTDLQPKQVQDLTYGLVQCAETGNMIPSSEFGTTVHARLEGYVTGESMEPSEYDAYAQPFVSWLAKEGVTPVHAELVVYDESIRIAGSVDFIGTEMNGNYILMDYKCRSCKGSGRGKFYDKDCAQLAIEAWMFARMKGLDYIPKCVSVCIDVDSKEHIHKEWSNVECYKGILRAKLLATLYWMDFMCEDIGQLKERKKEMLRDEIDMSISILKELQSDISTNESATE